MAKVNSVQDFFDGFKKFDINNADWRNMGSFPAVIRAVICLLIIAVMLGATYYFQIIDMDKKITRLVSEENTLKNQYKTKAYQVSNLDELREQMLQVRSIFQEQLERLPNGTQVAELLDDLEVAAISSGLTIKENKLGGQGVTDLFIEQNFDVKVEGTFHEIGSFVSAVSEMPRIITLHDFDIKKTSPEQQENKQELLLMSVKLKTYHYKDVDDGGLE
jgi:type IV pilus assembly protein PilO